MFIRKLLAAVVILCVTSPFVMAEEKKDLFDFSALNKKIEELGVPNGSEVDALMEKGKTLGDNKNWEKASLVFEECAKKANLLSDLVSALIEPYHSIPDYDSRVRLYNKLTKFIDFIENIANDYKRKRNKAMFMQAGCLINSGQKEKAVPLLVRVLELIDAEDMELWKAARNQLLLLIRRK